MTKEPVVTQELLAELRHCHHCDSYIGKEWAVKYCSKCGFPLDVETIQCKHCGYECQASWDYCTNCGKKIEW